MCASEPSGDPQQQQQQHTNKTEIKTKQQNRRVPDNFHSFTPKHNNGTFSLVLTVRYVLFARIVLKMRSFSFQYNLCVSSLRKCSALRVHSARINYTAPHGTDALCGMCCLSSDVLFFMASSTSSRGSVGSPCRG